VTPLWQSAQPAGPPSSRAALYRQVHRRVAGHLDRRVADSPHRADHALNRRAQLLDNLQALPLEQRAALILRTAGDLSHDEVGYVLDLAPAEARNVLVKARVALAEPGR
jgi:DNA-directed RNA polymerase specialized sigma24 family protein